MSADTLRARSPEARDLAEGGSTELYDAGEEHWTHKLHLGCGGVYLRGYINIDIAGGLASENPDIVEMNAADIWNYYAGLDGSAGKRRLTVADRIGDFMLDRKDWGYYPHSLDKVVCIQMFEHLGPCDGIALLQQLRYCLRPLAHLILSVPDMLGTLAWLEKGTEAQRAFAIRHLYGSRRDAYNHHKSWWTEETLGEILTLCGFAWATVPNFHVYPAVVLRATAV